MDWLTNHFKGHRGRAIVNVSLLLLFVFLFSYSILFTEWVGTPLLCGAIIILLTVNLIRMTERSNEDFAQFISNVYHDDFSSTSSLKGADASSRQFVDAQRSLLEKYRKLKADRSAQHEYLQLVVEHVETALICFDNSGHVEFINDAAKALLNNRYVNSLAKIEALCPPLASALTALKAGENRVIKVTIDDETVQLMLSATEFRLLGQDQKLVSMQNIKSALDEKEIESWQKLIKVLTHEIMNSMTPIVSLSNHLESLVHSDEAKNGLVDAEQQQDIALGIQSIAARSQGLLAFVDAYRSFSNLPKPVIREFSVKQLFDQVSALMDQRLHGDGIELNIVLSPQNLTLNGDINLLEQILINLINNASDAVSETTDAVIELRAQRQESGRCVIQVADNGRGIPAEHLDDIFTPFFTTREKGTGVGLSLSRQLARLNNASLTVTSQPGKGSVFQLQFHG